MNFSLQIDSPRTGQRARLASWRVKRLRLYIEAHLAQRLDTDVLAAVVHVSRSHFCRAFKRTFGVTTHWYVIQRRIERAKHLMLTTSATLADIATACGMSDHSHMTRLFRRINEEPPAVWRQRHLSVCTGIVPPVCDAEAGQQDAIDAERMAMRRLERGQRGRSSVEHPENNVCSGAKQW